MFLHPPYSDNTIFESHSSHGDSSNKMQHLPSLEMIPSDLTIRPISEQYQQAPNEQYDFPSSSVPQSPLTSLQIIASQSQQQWSRKLNNSSDRFIPNRISPDLYELVMKSEPAININDSEMTDAANFFTGDNPREELNSKLYSSLLEQTIIREQHPTQSHGILPTQVFKLCSQISKYPNKEFVSALGVQRKLLRYNNEKQKYKGYGCDSDVQTTMLALEHSTIIHPEERRRISCQPYKVLEATNLQDDFYLNLLDWSPRNYLAVGLKDEVVIWSGCNSTTTLLCRFPPNLEVSSVACSHHTNHIAVGDSKGSILIYDLTRKDRPIMTIKGHLSRIGSISWNGPLVASGSRDRSVLVRDLRDPAIPIQHYIGHKQEICGLKWSEDKNILASGGNDNKLFLWSIHRKAELAKFTQHTAAVKALGFSPHDHHILASGGGTADRCIRFWNTQTLKQVDCLDTGSQVCNLVFSKNQNEIVSTHGYSLNQIIVWKYPSMKKLATLTGHTQRVLYLAVSPCGQNIVTGAGDETLRFWNIFPSNDDHVHLNGTNSLHPSQIDLR